MHAAQTESEESVAVKIQYPGLAEGVTADVALLKRVLMPTKYHRIFAECFPAIERKVLEELDYRKEALYTELFTSRVDENRFVLPRVVKSLSTQRVLTTSKLSGMHLSKWLTTNPSQKTRDHFGQLLVDFFHDAAFNHRVIHADPNPGNYLFREDGRLGVIDFGCVVTFEPAFADAMSRLLGSNFDFDIQEEEALHNTAGIHYRKGNNPKAFAVFFKKWIQWLKEPYCQSGYNFGKNTDYFERGAQLSNEFEHYVDHYDGRFIYYGRTLHGVMRILAQLGARVNMAPPTVCLDGDK